MVRCWKLKFGTLDGLLVDVVVAELWIEVLGIAANEADHEESNTSKDSEDENKEKENGVTNRITGGGEIYSAGGASNKVHGVIRVGV